VIVRGEGAYVWDDSGKRYLDGLAGLFTVQVGHGRRELAEAAAHQAAQLAYFPLWSYAHPAAVDLAERLADAAPGDINRVFFTTGDGEAVESAWKLAKQYFKEIGKPLKHKVISRAVAYHGTPQGALSITGIPAARQMFEPLVPGAHKVPNTNSGIVSGQCPDSCMADCATRMTRASVSCRSCSSSRRPLNNECGGGGKNADKADSAAVGRT
jgi:adenosylmethionine-8-amino-7-oxononanoate aminotransferase